ncbi:hypothetical protein ASZ90_011184 [hydrocarbon metagenome]|uniref:Uncharacterized protein n=1 Tax=hydrocarbon metagenome TaxID=938273 RepID=A0A0W8FEF8_9ZZZZ
MNEKKRHASPSTRARISAGYRLQRRRNSPFPCPHLPGDTHRSPLNREIGKIPDPGYLCQD